MMATGNKRGRPPGDSPYPNKEKIKDQLVSWLAQGKTLREFCRQEGMPHNTVLYAWEQQDADFSKRIAQARVIGHNVIAEESLAIMDTEPLAVYDEAGNKRYDPGSIAWNKGRAEHRLKLLAKWNPRLYGDKTIIAGDDEAPLAVEVSFDVFGEVLKNLALTRQASE
jgi:hypothetical protein